MNEAPATVGSAVRARPARLLHVPGLVADEQPGHDAWRRLVATHGGRLPLRIKAAPEGTLVPPHNVLMTVESTDQTA